ncbi:hypothetical protein PR048_005417 [Dryococelus australis]|uniref:Uncharacterized protein n=1 Tax=Dryococelus australis TaxID=614101 RepID=A0ABQ9I936_9NEOP|nr:hypothetical protein PR048_005417 [Dryococelus australis]
MPDRKKKSCLTKATLSAFLSKALGRGQNTATRNTLIVTEKWNTFQTMRKILFLSQKMSHRNLIPTVKSDLTVKKVRKYKMPVEPGKSVSAEEVKEFCSNKEVKNK